MKKHIDLSGCGTALITPFKNGAVDYDAFAALVDRQVAAGIDVLVPLGTTGETPCLEDDERIKVLQIAKEHSNGLPIVVGGGTNSLQHTIRSMQMLEPYGVDAFLIVVPYYNKPTQEGQYQYFKAVAEATEKPIVLYNVPGRTGVNMTPETIARLATDCDNIIGVKEASGDLAQMERVKALTPSDFLLISGDDGLTVEVIKRGGMGVISVLANAYPTATAEVVRLALDGNTEEAAQKLNALDGIVAALFEEGNPVGIKTALYAKGVCSNTMRLPLVPGSDALQAKMKKLIAEYEK